MCHRRFALSCLALLIGFLFVSAAVGADNLSPLGTVPDWETLERYQETITNSDFTRLLQGVYCPKPIDETLLKIEAESVRILKNKDAGTHFTLRFATSEATRNAMGRSWMTAATLPPAKPGTPLSDVRIALDPGHLGGEWAQMEERWFEVNGQAPVQEGDMTLRVAQILAEKLRALGARVTLIKDKLEPVTKQRPNDFTELAKTLLKKAGVTQPAEDFTGPSDPNKEKTLRWQKEILFYRNSEIRSRAAVVNNRLRPDVVVALHFNAEAWGDPKAPALTDKNHFHVLVNGSYLPPELEFDDERFEMVRRLLSRSYAEEITLAEKLANGFAARTHLPPYEYLTDNVMKVGTSGFVYARNLIATRLYQCPVVYLEPYVMNSKEGYERIQAGDYEGMRTIAGKERPSIFREYADAVTDGLIAHYRDRK